MAHLMSSALKYKYNLSGIFLSNNFDMMDMNNTSFNKLSILNVVNSFC